MVICAFCLTNQCVQSVFIRVHLFKLNLALGNKQVRTWSDGYPSLECQRDLLKTETLKALEQVLEDKESWEALWG